MLVATGKPTLLQRSTKIYISEVKFFILHTYLSALVIYKLLMYYVVMNYLHPFLMYSSCSKLVIINLPVASISYSHKLFVTIYAQLYILRSSLWLT